MEEPFNPYATGESQQSYVNPAAGLAVTPMALTAILKTKFWVKLVGVVMIIISILMLIGGILGGNVSFVSLLVNLAMGIIYIIMSVRLIQYASAIQRLGLSKESNDLSIAIELQAKFWKLAGILMIIMIVLFLLVLISGAVMASRF